MIRLPAPQPLVLAMISLSILSQGIFANAGDKGIVKDVGGLKAELMIGAPAAAGEPKIGDNEILLRLHDADDKPVADASLMMSIAMDKGSSMSMDMEQQKAKSVTLVADAATPGLYKGTVNFDFKGKWVASMDLTRGGMMEKASFEFEVSQAGPNWSILIGFGLVIVIVMGGAALLRSKKPKASSGSAA